MGWGSRRSVSSYMSNHIGSFAASMEAQCRSLFLGGVTRRFPELAFGLLEGGVSWACQLLADLVGHWEKRNRESIHHLDPARIDTALVMRLFEEYGDAHFHAGVPGLLEAFTKLEPEPPFLDEWEACGIESASTSATASCRASSSAARPTTPAWPLPSTRGATRSVRSSARCSPPTSATGTCRTWRASCRRPSSSWRTDCSRPASSGSSCSRIPSASTPA